MKAEFNILAGDYCHNKGLRESSGTGNEKEDSYESVAGVRFKGLILRIG